MSLPEIPNFWVCKSTTEQDKNEISTEPQKRKKNLHEEKIFQRTIRQEREKSRTESVFGESAHQAAPFDENIETCLYMQSKTEIKVWKKIYTTKPTVYNNY